jgi:hypothetical protein
MMLKTLTVAAATAVLAGCAGMHQIESEVSTYSEWKPDRKPGTYAFERLPSQQADPQRAQMLEDAARPWIEAAGFKSVPDPAVADVTVQLNARTTSYDRAIYDDPFWWHGGVFAYRGGRGFYGPGWGPGGPWGGPWGPYGCGGFGCGGFSRMPYYEREVALLIRDRQANKPIYEAHAVSGGNYSMSQGLLPSMFEAAMKDFPYGGLNPRKVITRID